MDYIPLYWAIPVFMSLVLIEIFYEYREGEKTHRFNSTLANLSVGAVEMIVGASSHLIVLFVYILAFESIAIFQWENTAAIWLIGLLAYEFCYYWKHRFGHEVNLLWGAHVVHHQSEDMNFSTAVRLSATSSIWGSLFYLPVAILGVPPFVFMIVKALTLTYQFFIHTEHISRLPAWFEFIFNSPAHHRVHHACQEQYLDKNYGSLLIIWDRLFGTFADEKEQPVYGAVKKIDSWNPVYVNTAYYHQIVEWLKQSRSIKDTLQIVFGRPDSLPQYLFGETGSMKGEKLIKPNEKYDAGHQNSRLLKFYCLLQFIVALSLAFCLLFFYEDLRWWEIGLISLWSLTSLSLLGKLLQGDLRNLFRWESTKHLAMLVVMIIMLEYGSIQIQDFWFLISLPSIGIVLSLFLRPLSVKRQLSWSIAK